jgi:hypothetical protein
MAFLNSDEMLERMAKAVAEAYGIDPEPGDDPEKYKFEVMHSVFQKRAYEAAAAALEVLRRDYE